MPCLAKLPRLRAGQLSSPFQHTEVHQAHHDDPVQKAVNSGMGFIVGDILAQRLTGEAFDAVRSLELGLYGTLLGSHLSAAPHPVLLLYPLVFSTVRTLILWQQPPKY